MLLTSCGWDAPTPPVKAAGDVANVGGTNATHTLDCQVESTVCSRIRHKKKPPVAS